MKRCIKIQLTTVLAGVLLIGGILVWKYLRWRDSDIPPLTIPATERINYNNYLLENPLDHKGDYTVWERFSLLGEQVLLSSSSGEVEALSGVTTPCQIWENHIFFLRKDALLQKPLKGGNERNIADSVSSFIVAEGSVYYLCRGELFSRDLTTGSVQLLADKIYLFYFHNNQVFVMDETGVVSCLEPDDHWRTVCTIRFGHYPFLMMPQREYVIDSLGYGLRYTNTSDGSTTIVPLINNEYVNHRISFISDEDRTFVSFHATETEGSMVSEVDHPSNGVWVIEPETKIPKKICGETFDGLYLFGEEGLFGTRNDVLYQINPYTGQVTRM